MLGREMIDEKPLDCCREQVAAERIETGETLCSYATQQTQQREEKLMWGILLGALLRVAVAKADGISASALAASVHLFSTSTFRRYRGIKRSPGSITSPFLLLSAESFVVDACARTYTIDYYRSTGAFNINLDHEYSQNCCLWHASTLL